MTAKQKPLDLKSCYVIEHSLDSSMSFKAIAGNSARTAPPYPKKSETIWSLKSPVLLVNPSMTVPCALSVTSFRYATPALTVPDGSANSAAVVSLPASLTKMKPAGNSPGHPMCATSVI